MARLMQCLCGSASGTRLFRGTLELLFCGCGIARRGGEIDVEAIEESYRSGAYHHSESRHPNCTPYLDRYVHDRAVAMTRWQRYTALLPQQFARVRRTVDVGCANGAFVDHLWRLGLDAWGIEPAAEFAGATIVTGTLADLFAADETRLEALADTPLLPGQADLVTYHDVLEHFFDPALEVHRACRLLAPGGLIVIDVPDVWNGGGDHHFKDEHLWYFTRSALEGLLWREGVEVVAHDRPIPGKLVVYGQHP